jgi:DNA primase
LYNLKAVLKAKVVYVVEGEKCGDRLIKRGLVATTSAHGAKSPKETDWSPLKGKKVFILPDRDDPGGDYANKVLAILKVLNS